MSSMPTIMVAHCTSMLRPVTLYSIMAPAVIAAPMMAMGGNVLADHARAERRRSPGKVRIHQVTNVKSPATVAKANAAPTSPRHRTK